MHRILVIRLYFPLGALHVSNYIIPSSGATFTSCTSHLIYANTFYCCVVIGRNCYSHTTVRRIDTYQMRCPAYNVAPDDGLI